MKEPCRCGWAGNDPVYIAYHDAEWGRPEHDDRKLFEMLILEGMQAGLSWITILRKRENFRKAFDNFDPNKVAEYGEEKIAALLADSGIVRNRLKINAAVANAKAFLEVQREFGSFDKFIRGYVNDTPIINRPKTLGDVPASTPLSDRISRDLKKRGFKFVGTTIIYSFMQAVGIVDDHLVSCFCHSDNRKLHKKPR
ncbi:MAG: DNA-3-methyladenine glycosylase I [Lachnospiraceae bacterium]|nr:DNA-3-methyladenine glycosylase I [Ruminococcus sp.]MCM1275146.1 DNA-3-methyladenine glycosylase I [Lachnospiraceae bacterium]